MDPPAKFPKKERREIMKKNWQWSDKGINWFFTEILMIKQSCKLIGQEPNWSHPTKTGGLTCYIPLISIRKKISTQRYHLLFLIDIDDQRILQSDWTRGTSGHDQRNVLVPDTTFVWWRTPYRKTWLFQDIL